MFLCNTALTYPSCMYGAMQLEESPVPCADLRVHELKDAELTIGGRNLHPGWWFRTWFPTQPVNQDEWLVVLKRFKPFVWIKQCDVLSMYIEHPCHVFCFHRTGTGNYTFLRNKYTSNPVGSEKWPINNWKTYFDWYCKTNRILQTNDTWRWDSISHMCL